MKPLRYCRRFSCALFERIKNVHDLFSLSVYVFLLFSFQRFSHPFHFTIILVDISAYIPERLFFSAKATDCLRVHTHTHTHKSLRFFLPPRLFPFF